MLIITSLDDFGEIDGSFFFAEDLLTFDISTRRWSMLFDGSDVGLSGVNVDALLVEQDGSLLMSVDRRVVLTGVGTVDGEDILRSYADAAGR